MGSVVRKTTSGDFYQLKHRISQIMLPKCITKYSDVLCQFIHYTNSGIIKGSHIEVDYRMEFSKHDFQFNYDTKCRVYVAILHHSGLLYKMF